MPRIIIHEAQAPMEITVGGESKWLCRCGLSKGQPYCDGSHKKTAGEEKGKLYFYDKQGNRVDITSWEK